MFVRANALASWVLCGFLIRGWDWQGGMDGDKSTRYEVRHGGGSGGPAR